MNKRLILILVFVLMITGCGNSNSTEEQTGADSQNNEKGIYVSDEESKISEIALSFSLKNISPTGATLVFEQYDADAPKGELYYGEEYVIEVKKNGKWEKVPTVIENPAFNLVAMTIKLGDTVESKLDWECQYGELEPGEYRIGKGVEDFIKSGKFDKYMVYAHFILN